MVGDAEPPGLVRPDAEPGLHFPKEPFYPERIAAAADLMAAYNATSARETDFRRHLLLRLLGSVGEGTEIRPPLYVDYGYNLHLGARCFANYGLVALDMAEISIGDDAWIGPNVQLLTPHHPVEPELRMRHLVGARPIRIGANVWLGGGVIVLPGVTVGEDSVVGAGGVVTRDIPPGVVAIGNPARVTRTVAR